MVYVCGEMSSEPLYAIILLGMGINVFSMNPLYIPIVKRALRKIEMKRAKEIVNKAFEESPEKMESFLLKEIESNFGETLKEI